MKKKNMKINQKIKKMDKTFFLEKHKNEKHIRRHMDKARRADGSPVRCKMLARRKNRAFIMQFPFTKLEVTEMKKLEERAQEK